MSEKEQFIEAVETAKVSITSGLDGICANHYLDSPDDRDWMLWHLAKEVMREALEEWAAKTSEEAGHYVRQ